MAKLERGAIVKSPVTARRYRLDQRIGAGGYGQAFAATELGGRRREVCFKHTRDPKSWQRESYFGELLFGHRRTIQLYDAFAIAAGRGVRYCLVLELARHGCVTDYFARGGAAYAPERAAREIAGLLRALDALHRMRATHRDVTPLNVFVCDRGLLKLGDFGVARHEVAGLPAREEAFNEDFVTSGMADAERGAWTPADDVYQVGQLFAMLVLGRPKRVTLASVRRLRLPPQLEAVIRCAIGPRTRRYADAAEMMRALSRD
jgi:serine/threonine protein kinase